MFETTPTGQVAATVNRRSRPSVPRLTEEERMRARWTLIAVVALASLAVSSSPVSAGGSWLETDQPWYAPGETAVARGVFADGTYRGTVADGPFFLYMVPGYRYLPRNGSIPGWAEPVGSLTIKEATGNYCCWVASATFTVPQVPPGRYTLDYCNDPCTLDGIGDLVGGSFWVAATEEQARLMARIERLERKADALSRTKRDLRKAEAALARAQTRYDRLVGLLRAAQSDEAPSAAKATEPAERPVPAWAVVVGLAVLAGGAWFRRRVGQAAVPDFVPDELVRDAQVPSRQPMTSRGRPAMSMPAPPFTKS
jgi:hypothetical protein